MKIVPSFLMAAALLAPAAPARASTGLEVEAGTPDELCPDVATTREAVRGRVGGVLVGARAGTWRARYSTWYAPDRPEGRLLRLEIFDPTGRLEKSSDVSATGESCGALAQILAVKIETHFRARESATQSAPAPALALAEKRWALGLGAVLLSGGPVPGIELHGRVRLGRMIGLGLSAVLPPVRRSQPLVGGGTASSRAVPVRLGLGLALLSAGRWRIELGPEALVSIEKAETDDIALPAYDTRVVVGIGSAGGASYLVAPQLSLTLVGSVVGTLPLATSQLAVRNQQGYDEEVLRPPGVLGRLSLGIAYAF